MSDNMQSAALPFRQHTYEKKISTEGESYWLACKAVCHKLWKLFLKLLIQSEIPSKNSVLLTGKHQPAPTER